MNRRVVSIVCIVVAVAATLPLGHSPASAQTPSTAWAEIAELVPQHFLDPRLRGLDWDDIVRRTTAAIERRPEHAASLIRDALGLLRDGHTGYFTADQRAYYELLDVFNSDGVNGHPVLPEGERVHYVGVGMATTTIDGRVFAADVYAGGPAHRAGVLPGDELISVDGKPWGDIAPFRERAGRPTTARLRRRADGPARTVSIVPQRIQPRDLFASAIEREADVFVRDGRRLAYIRTRSHAHTTLIEPITTLLRDRFHDADGLILDMRGGWGGRSLELLDLFNPLQPTLTYIRRDGSTHSFATGWTKPVVALIDRGCRSSKELLAHAFKAHPGVTLVGERTAGAVTGGRLFTLGDGSALYLGVLDVRVDGTTLEGHGVKPDVEVLRALPYAAGTDPQLEAAIAELRRRL